MRSRKLLKVKARAAAVVVVAMSVVPGTARAQSDAQNTGTARALYDQAVIEIASGDYEKACPKLETSVKLEPAALGAKITLAECYEGGGKLASAWSTYLQIEAAAGAVKQTARQIKAHERAEALRPRLAQLIIVVPEEVQSLPGLTILRDGVEIQPAVWSVPIPVDKGIHQVVMTATHEKRVEQNFEVYEDGQSITVKLPGRRKVARPPGAGPITDPGAHMERAGLPRVHIDNDDPSMPLELLRVDGVLSSSVCKAPCDIGVDSEEGRYFILGGKGITASGRFRLQDMGDPAIVQVSPGSHAAWASGLVFTILGLVSLGTGAVTFGIGSATSSGAPRTWGQILLGTGGGVTLIGVPMWLANRTTFKIRGAGLAAEF